MKPPHHRGLKITFLLGALLLCSPLGVWASVVIYDSFQLTEARVAGAALSGISTEVGGATWTGSANYVFGGDVVGNEYVTSSVNSNIAMGVAFSFSSYASYGNVATIDALVSSANVNGGWNALVFGRSNSLSPTSNGVVWLQISTNLGTWSLMSLTTTLATGSLADVEGYSVSGFNSYSLSYDQSEKAVVGASINGVELLSQAYFISVSSTINIVGLFNQNAGGTGQTKIDSFGVSVIPEPASYGFVLGGLLLVGVVARRSVRHGGR